MNGLATTRAQPSKAGRLVPKHVWIPALAFTGLLLGFFIAVFFLFPTLSPDRRDLLHLLAAFTGGFAAGFMGGTVTLHFGVPRRNLGKAAISATSGIAVFLFLYLESPFWYAHAPAPEDTSPKLDRSDLAISLDAPTQDVPLIRATPHYEGKVVFCEAVRSGVIISHNQAGDRPIRVTRLALESEQVVPTPKQLTDLDYAVDVRHLNPRGIVELREYLFILKPEGVEGRFLKGLRPQDAIRVAPQNIFASTHRTEAVTIEPKGNDAHFQLVTIIQALRTGLYRARFNAEYDVAGVQKSVKTEWLYIYKK